MKSNQNEISFRHKKSHVYISFHCEPNEIEIIFVFIFWSTYYLCCNEKFASADDSFRRISFRVVFT